MGFALFIGEISGLIVIIVFTTMEIPRPILHAPLFLSLRSPDIFSFVLIPATMAFYTNLVVVYAFFHMLLTDLGAGVLMAAVAGVAFVVVFDMTGLAIRPMVLVEAEVLIMLEGCRGPTRLRVA